MVKYVRKWVRVWLADCAGAGAGAKEVDLSLLGLGWVIWLW